MPEQPKKWRYPAQPEIYQENPAMLDYEGILGESELNIDVEQWLAETAEAVLTPEERAGEDAEWKTLTMREKLRGPPVAYLNTPGLRKEEAGSADEQSWEEQHQDVARPLSALFRKRSKGKAPQGEKGKAKPRRRTPRCTKKVRNERVELVAHWLQDSAANSSMFRTAKQMWGIGRRMTLLYIQKARKYLADEACAVDHLAELARSKAQRERLIQIGLKNLDKIEDPTKVPSMLRAVDNLIKHRDETQEEIRHYRVVTRRDTSVDSKAKRMLREKMIQMPHDELLERQEHMRNRWFHEWNQCRIMEKHREGTLGPGWIESPYVAAVMDPRLKPQPTLGPPGTEFCI